MNRLACLCLVCLLFAFAASVRADIFQWEYINPANPSLGKQQSTTLCPDGAGVNAVPNAYLSGRNLTMAYLIGMDLTGINVGQGNLTNADLSQSNLTNGYFHLAAFTNADLHETNLSNTYLDSTNFTDANLTQANLANAGIYSATLTSRT